MINTISIDEIVIDLELYPRSKQNWMLVYQYLQALRAGAIFPNIIVAELDRKYVLVDGAHRLAAYQKAGETHVTVEILTGLIKGEIYAKAVELNSTHGENLSL